MGHFANGTLMKTSENHLKQTGARRANVSKIEVALVPWRVDFYDGGQLLGFAHFDTADLADAAVADFLFSEGGYAHRY